MLYNFRFHFLGQVLAVLSFCFLQSCHSSKQASPEATRLFKSVIPKPVSAVLEGKTFTITKKTFIEYEGNEEVQNIANLLSAKLKPATDFDWKVSASTGPQSNGSIYLSLSGADTTLGSEGYELTIREKSIKLTAKKPAGLFMGIQTLRQLLPGKIEQNAPQDGPWEIATGTIRDTPVYPWRGSMLDVARHFLTVDNVKRYIEYISLYKMNVLHLHLSDDQGWRIEIKSWPNLTAIGSKTQVGGGNGGFYTQDQYADIVAYAKARYVMIVPEVDMPGHINAALASYPELNESGKATELYTGTKVGFSTLSLKREATFRFVQDVIREISSLTPGLYFHIGGDESHVTKKEDYKVFINKFRKIAEANGKTMIGWEEIAQGDIDSTVIAHHWASADFARLAASKGARVILSPATNVYLDMKYDSASRIGYNWAAYIDVDSSYKWKPEVKISGVPKKNILGVEAPLWSETIKNFDDVEYLTFPRIPGVAEIGWTPTENRNWDEYKIRLGNQAKRFKALDIDYYRSALVPWVD